MATLTKEDINNNFMVDPKLRKKLNTWAQQQYNNVTDLIYIAAGYFSNFVNCHTDGFFRIAFDGDYFDVDSLEDSVKSLLKIDSDQNTLLVAAEDCASRVSESGKFVISIEGLNLKVRLVIDTLAIETIIHERVPGDTGLSCGRMLNEMLESRSNLPERKVQVIVKKINK